MCGICGIVGPRAKNSEARTSVSVMMHALAHRGPDDEGCTQGQEFIFGHRRLAIIDPANGQQPLASPDKTVTLVYNGEIYNHLELRASHLSHHVFTSNCDTETLLHLYQEVGPDCVNLLEGMFAFALYDSRRNLFMAARDHFGIKPLYLHQSTDGALFFASEIKALIALPEVPSILDPHALNQYLVLQYCLGDKTMFKGVTRLEPGCMLLWTPGQEKPATSRYWDVAYNIDFDRSEGEWIEELTFLLEDSVRKRLRSDVALGTYLSGGLDSSTVTGLASRMTQNPLTCFTGKFHEGPQFDESHYARTVCSSFGCTLQEIAPTLDDFINTMPEAIRMMDEPAAGPGLFAQYMVSDLASKDVKVVLGGQGGDELFGGYARYLVAYLEQSLHGSIMETQKEGRHIVTLKSIIPNMPSLKGYESMLKSFFSDGLFDSVDRRYFSLIDRSKGLEKILSPEFAHIFNREQVFEEFQEVFNRDDILSFFNKMTHYDQKTQLPALLHVEDRVSMAFSLESRVPLLDHRIAELLSSMPPSMKLKGGEGKYILKKCVEKFLPPSVVGRKDKMGFPVPLTDWMKKPKMREFLKQHLRGGSGIFDQKALCSAIDKEAPFGRLVWGALCIEMWHEICLNGRCA